MNRDTHEISYQYENDVWVETRTLFHKRSPVIVNHSPTIERNESNDRVIPMETVTIQSFRREKSAEVEDPIIHIGYAADEFARSYNSLAIVMTNHIYFRNNAYRPETEEGRALLAHELTHV